MKLGIFGCSFTANEDWAPLELNVSWPEILSKHYTKVTNFGMCGSSTYGAYQLFIENFNQLDYIVFSYTAAYRIPYLPKGYEHTAWMLDEQDCNGKGLPATPEGELDLEDLNFPPAITTYQKYFYSDSLNRFICNNVYKSVNEICERHNKKLVNLIPFDDPDRIIEYPAEVRFPTIIGIDNVSRLESGMTLYDTFGSEPVKWKPSEINGITEKSDTYDEWLDSRPCHLNFHNNKTLADIIQKEFENPRYLSKQYAPNFSGWDFSQKTWESWAKTPYGD